jgi:SAM-dependent methyltransferase
MESTNPDFWDTRYRSGKTPWDFHGIPKALQEFLQSTTIKGRVLIPGCGSGYEIKAFADAGWDPVGIDFSQAAVERAKSHLGDLADKIKFGNFFEYSFGPEKFDLIYERTFLCSMSPKLWRSYAIKVAELLHDRGTLAGFFLYGAESNPPPYPLAEGQLQTLLGSNFQKIERTRATDSLEIFSTKEEFWEVWKKS